VSRNPDEQGVGETFTTEAHMSVPTEHVRTKMSEAVSPGIASDDDNDNTDVEFDEEQRIESMNE